MGEMHVGRRTIGTSHTDRSYYPDDGLTKGDVIGYYHRIAAWLLPHVADRPLVMHRFPEGIDGDDFYHKDVPGHFPGWIDTVEIAKEEGGSLRQVVCDDRFTTEQRKRARRGRLYVDTQRNAYGQTTVAPYALRALPGAPVAVPLDWDELSGFEPRRIDRSNVFRRLAQKQDPWRDIQRHARSLAGPASRLRS